MILPDSVKKNKTHGSGEFRREEFFEIGENVVFETGVMVFHPETITLEENVYVGHQTILKGYYNHSMKIGAHTWIGQQCFFHSAGGIEIGKAVGIGPKVSILTSQHKRDQTNKSPILFCELEFKKVILKDGCDVGVGSIILPGVTIGEGAVVAAGAVVNKDVPPYETWGGVPAKKLN